MAELENLDKGTANVHDVLATPDVRSVRKWLLLLWLLFWQILKLILIILLVGSCWGRRYWYWIKSNKKS